MRVADVMTQNVYSIREWEELGLSSDLMRFRRFRHLPVVDAHGKVKGMISRLDLLEQASKPGNPRLIPVYDAMKRPAITIGPDAEIEDAAELMREKQIHSLAVVDQNGELKGILTDSDILGALSGRRAPVRDFATLLVSRVMTPDPVVIGTDASLGDAVGAILEGGFRHLPVVDGDGKLIGMISERDLRSQIGTDFLDWTTLEQTRLDDPVTNVMVPDPVVVRADNKLTDVLDVFTDEKIGAVPVLDRDDLLVGILSYVDVIAWLQDHARAMTTETGAETSISE